MTTPFASYTGSSGTAGQNFSTYVPGTGDAGTWSPVPQYPGTAVLDSAKSLMGTSANGTPNYWLNSATPPTADYTVEADFVFGADQNVYNHWLFARLVTSGTWPTGYGLTCNGFQGWKLWRLGDGTATIGTSTVTGNPAPSSTVHAKLTVKGSLITATLSGAQTGTWSATDATNTAAGRAGIGFESNHTATDGPHLANFAATKIATPALTVKDSGGTAHASGTAISLGTVATGASAQAVLTIANIGDGTATLGTLAVGGSASISGTNPGGNTIAASGSTTVTVALSTASPGFVTGTLSIPSDDAASPYTLTFTAGVVTANGSAPAGAPTGVTLTGPSSGSCGQASTNFAVAIAPATPAVASPITFTLSDGASGGTFSTPTLGLGTTPSSGTFTYSNPLCGTYTLTVTNNGGLPTRTITYKTLPQLGITPVVGATNSPDFGGLNLAARNPYFAELCRDITNDPVDPNSATWMTQTPANGLHPDFGVTPTSGSTAGAGIPFVVVSGTQAKVLFTFGLNGAVGYGAQESDAVLGGTTGATTAQYPAPANAPIEGLVDRSAYSGDAHLLIYDRDNDLLYECWTVDTPDGGSTYRAGNGAIFDLSSLGGLRPADWTSGDAAGLPILPFLVRWDEANRGLIPHAIRATFNHTGFTWGYPARHQAGGYTQAPPMGARARLKASVYAATKDSYTGHARAILDAVYRYGVVNADNGGNWFITGAPDPRWDTSLSQLANIHPNTDFEWIKPIPGYVVTGPTTGTLGTPATYTVSLFPAGDTNIEGITFDLYDAASGANVGTFAGSGGGGAAQVVLTDSQTSGTFTYTPATTGNISFYALSNTHRHPAGGTYTNGVGTGRSAGNWVAAPALTVSVTGVATTYFATPAATHGSPGVGVAVTYSLPAGTTVTGTVHVTPTATGGGTFSPSTLSLTTGSPSATATFTPAGYGSKTLSGTNDGGLANPSPVAFLAADTATGFAGTGPANGASFPVALPANTTIVGTITITPHSSGGGTFYPPTIQLTASQTTGTFAFIPNGTSATTITFTNDGGLANPAPQSYTPGASVATFAPISGGMVR